MVMFPAPTCSRTWCQHGHPLRVVDKSTAFGTLVEVPYPYTKSHLRIGLRKNVHTAITLSTDRDQTVSVNVSTGPVSPPSSDRALAGFALQRLMVEYRRHIAVGMSIASLLFSPISLMSGAGMFAVTAVTADAAQAVTNEQLLYLEAWRAVDRAYVDKTFNNQSWFRVREDALKKKKLITREDTYSEIKSMLASLNDPFTRFLEPEQYKALRGTTSGGDVTGVGLEVSFSTGASATTKGDGKRNPLLVVSPASGGPAERAGIKPGDEILQIDGKSTEDMSLYAAGNALQGPAGSKVVLKVESHANPFFEQAKEITLTREKINMKNVDSATCKSSTSGSLEGKTIGYIRISNFSKKTAEKVREALENFQASSNNAVGYYVIDVRNNGGGVFNAGIQVARMLINSGDLVLIADSDGVRDVYEAEGEAIDTKTPMIVLVNKGTASASEVLAGALKDNTRAKIVGENTFGKGLIQTLVELSDGSAVTVTVSKYQTPNGIDINKTGIDPDVRLTEEELESIPLGSEQFCAYIQDANKSIPLSQKIFF